jgi:hypothetical protein
MAAQMHDTKVVLPMLVAGLQQANKQFTPTTSIRSIETSRAAMQFNVG